MEHLHQSLRISPRDPLRYNTHNQLAQAYFFAKDYAKALDHALIGASEAPNLSILHGILAVTYVGLGNIEKAREELETGRRLAPEYFQSRLDGVVTYRNPENRQRYLMFLRIAAGLEDPSAAEALR